MGASSRLAYWGLNIPSEQRGTLVSTRGTFEIVALVALAGGLRAFIEVLSRLPPGGAISLANVTQRHRLLDKLEQAKQSVEAANEGIRPTTTEVRQRALQGDRANAFLATVVTSVAPASSSSTGGSQAINRRGKRIRVRVGFSGEVEGLVLLMEEERAQFPTGLEEPVLG